MEFKLTINDPKSKKTYKQSVKDADADRLIGKRIGETFRGEICGLTGFELQITGGSDNAGFPMRSDVIGQARQKLLSTKGVGIKLKPKKRGKKRIPARKGQKKRKTVHGNTISNNIVQINCKVVKEGSQPIDKILGAKEEKSGEESAEKKE